MSQEAFSRNYELKPTLSRPYVSSAQTSIVNKPTPTPIKEDITAEEQLSDDDRKA